MTINKRNHVKRLPLANHLVSIVPTLKNSFYMYFLG